MSSMFKKKSGLAFKPKIPSARPRAPAPAAPARSSSKLDTPNADNVSNAEPPQETSDQTAVPPEIAEVESEPRDERPQTQETSVDSTTRQLHDTASTSHAEAHTIVSNGLTKANATPQSIQEGPGEEGTGEEASCHTDLSAVIEPDGSSGAQEGIDDGTSPNQPDQALEGSSRDDVLTSTEPTLVPSSGTGVIARSSSTVERHPVPPSAPVDSSTLPATPRTEPLAAPADGTETTRKRQQKTTLSSEKLIRSRSKRRTATSVGKGNSTPRKRKARSCTPEDAESQTVDLQKLKMSDLTRDLHIGKKFSRHDELRERERQARLKIRLGKDTASVSEQDNRETRSQNSEVQGSATADPTAATNREATPAPAPAPVSTPAPASAPGPASGPQFRIVDGQIVVDQSSLEMDRHARAAAAQAGQDMETIEENDFTRLITSSSFMNTSKLRGPNLWTDDDTELFYRGLKMFGTDFEMISKMFPGKQRRHVKLKYNREERHNAGRIDAVLIGEKTIKMDIDEYKSMTGSEFEPVEKIEAEQRKIEEDFEAERSRVAEEQAEIMRKKREVLFAEDDNNGSETGNGNGNGNGSERKRGKRGKKTRETMTYGLNGEPVTSNA